MKLFMCKRIIVLIFLLTFIFLIFGNDFKKEKSIINDFKMIYILKDNKIFNDLKFDWRKEYNLNNYFNIKKMIKTQDEGYALVGEINRPDKKKTESYYEQYSNIFVIKSKKNGEKEWVGEIDFNDRLVGFDIINTKDNNYFVLGGEYNPAYENDGTGIICGKFDIKGKELWKQKYIDNELRFRSIIEAKNNIYNFFGYKWGKDKQSLNIFKSSEYGEKKGEDEINIPYLFRINKSIKINEYENILLDDGNFSFIKVSINDLTKILWSKNFFYTSDVNKLYYLVENPTDIYKTNDNYIIVTGKCYIEKKVFFGLSKEVYRGVFVFKTDIEGNPIWVRTFIYDKNTDLNGAGIIESKSGDYIVSGNITKYEEKIIGDNNKKDRFETDKKMLLLKINRNGDYQWIKIFKDEKYKTSELKYIVPLLEDNSVVVVGNGYIEKDKISNLILGKINVD